MSAKLTDEVETPVPPLLALLQGELDFAQQKTEGLEYKYIIATPQSNPLALTAPLAGEPVGRRNASPTSPDLRHPCRGRRPRRPGKNKCYIK